jgi:hypothetical protein
LLTYVERSGAISHSPQRAHLQDWWSDAMVVISISPFDIQDAFLRPFSLASIHVSVSEN